MIGPTVSLFSSRIYRPLIVFRFLILLSRLWYWIRGRKLEFDSERFEKAAWVSKFRDETSGHHYKSIEIVVVSTRKDFGILPASIDYALKAISSYTVSGIRLIVPFKDIQLCQDLLPLIDYPVKIVDEESMVSNLQFQRITDAFKSRNTWILQQILKVQAVLSSTSDSVLILDSDTILLRPRSWFSKDGKQILMPSMEFNPSYYKFLHELQISELKPKYTFISHHMIMQPKIFTEILQSIELYTADRLIDYICKKADTSVSSPVCVEYELYGQYLYETHPGLIFIGRWSNLSIPRKYSPVILKSKLLVWFFKIFYNSISFHSWS